MSDYEVLNKINSPADVKKLNAAERKELAAEMRAAILNRVSKIGGHLGPNLGTVELAIALHTVFDSPKDKIILDVSHQSYPHKLLTGRRQGFQSDEHFRDISGYTNPQESEHDVFIVGHTSTSVSLAAGLAKARDMQGQKFNVVAVIGDGKSYGEYVADYLEEQAVRNDKLAVINAATPGALMLRNFREKHPEKYFDVGIAEEHAVAFTSALAKGGMQPVALFFGGFIQRAYDQLSQDLCLNNSPAVLVIENCGITGMDATHLSIFDIPLMSNIPNLVYLAPSTVEELRRMLDWAMAQKDFPVALRTPATMPRNLQYAPKQPLELNKFEITKQGSKVALIGLGGMLALAEDVAGKLAEKGIEATIVNPRFITGLDEELLSGLVRNHDVVVTLEDGVVSGGFGEKIARFYGDKAVKVYNFGAAKEFTDRVPAEELYRRYELTPEQIVKKILPLDNA